MYQLLIPSSVGLSECPQMYVYNGNIYTGIESIEEEKEVGMLEKIIYPWFGVDYLSKLKYAKALVIDDGIILRTIYKKKEMKKYTEWIKSNCRNDEEENDINSSESTVIINANEKLVLPGFIDSHIHSLKGGRTLLSVQLHDCLTRYELYSKLKQHIQKIPEGTWVLGGNWNNEFWSNTDLPDRFLIDDISPNNPVFICKSDGHQCLANSLALEIANITRDSPEIVGGTIVRNDDGEPTGILKDNAMGLVTSILPPESDRELDTNLEVAMDFLAEYGITSFHEMIDDTFSDSFEVFKVFQRARNNNKLKQRVYFAASLSDPKRVRDFLQKNPQYKDDKFLRLTNLKGFLDGSLGSATAKMFKPYKNTKNNTGLFLTDLDDIYNYIVEAHEYGLQVSVHSIGDRANHEIINTMERVANAYDGDIKEKRMRIEHCQHIRPDDQKRLSKYGIIASSQPAHLLDDGLYFDKYLTADIKDISYPFRSILSYDDTSLAFGSDWYVADPNPFLAIFASVTRKLRNGNIFVPNERISIEQAVRAYTYNAAFAEFMEHKKGKLLTSFLADLVIVDKNIFELNKLTEVINTNVLMTIVDGIIRYKSSNFKY